MHTNTPKSYWIADDYTSTFRYKNMLYIRESKWMWIYLLFNKETGLTKIGITTNMKERKRSLQNSCGTKLELLACALMEPDYSPKAAEIEKYLHECFSEKRKVGEWFSLSVRDIIQAAMLFSCVCPGDILRSERGMWNPFDSKNTIRRHFHLIKQ